MLTLFLALFAVLCPAHAERPLPPRPGTLTGGAELQYFKSSANYTSGGASHGLLSGNSYTNTQGVFGASYDFTKFLRAYTSLSFSQAESVSDDTVNPGQQLTRDNSGLNEIAAGAMGWFNFGPFSLAPQAGLVYPFWRVNEDSDSPLIGEGATRLQLGTWALFRVKWFTPYGFAGYENRDGGRSGLLHYALGAHFKPGMWWIQGEFRGFTSLTDDGDAANPAVRDPYITRVNGGSYRFYSVNPHANELAFETGVRFGSWNLYGGLATTVTGASYADGLTFLGGITFSGRITRPSPSRPEPEEPQFEMEKDKYDESLFQENKPKPEERKIKRKVRKQPSVDKLLHETEKDLQQEDQ